MQRASWCEWEVLCGCWGHSYSRNHQQLGDRSCKNEAIGGAHFYPVTVYLSKVADAATPDGPAGRSKIFQDAWPFVCERATLDNYGANLWLLQKTGGRVGDDDNWGTKDLNTCCGKTNVKIPSDIAAEDYLLRAEALALYTAGKANGAQFYMTCCTSCTP